MQNILMRAASFIMIIILGYTLRKYGFFQKDDFNVLQKIVLKITLPAAIICNFGSNSINVELLYVVLIGFGAGLLYMWLGYLINKQKGRAWQAFGILNLSGYNIGNFTMPFTQGFLGPIGVIVTSMYDVGNAFICFGGAYSVASIVKGNSRFSIKEIIKKLLKSFAFDCYVVMIFLSLINLSVPKQILSIAEIIGNANAFVAMLMLGVGIELSDDTKQTKKILPYLSIRYGIALIIALGCFYLLPFSLEVRKALVILAFSPIASSVPAFTHELKGDVGLSSALNSLSIVCSIVFIVFFLICQGC